MKTDYSKTKLPHTLQAYRSHRRYQKAIQRWLDRALAQNTKDFTRQWDMMESLDAVRLRWFQDAFAADTADVNRRETVALLSIKKLSDIAQKELRRIREEQKRQITSEDSDGQGSHQLFGGSER